MALDSKWDGISMAEFREAINQLPKEWLDVPRAEISTTEYRGMLLLITPSLQPLVWKNNGWDKLDFKESDEPA